MTALFDTSMFIAFERGDLDPATVPMSGAVSTITLAELWMAVLRSSPGHVRAIETLVAVEQEYEALPVDTFVARQFARFVVESRARGLTPSSVDALIASTALVHGLPLYTRDRDFEMFDGLDLQLL